MLLRPIHVAANAKISFFLKAEKYSTVYMHNVFIHSPFDGHLGCFLSVHQINNVAMNIGRHVSFQIIVFVFFFSNIYPGVELVDHTVVLFLIVETLHTVFHSDCTNLQFHH